jgi:hypothetical protein
MRTKDTAFTDRAALLSYVKKQLDPQDTHTRPDGTVTMRGTKVGAPRPGRKPVQVMPDKDNVPGAFGRSGSANVEALRSLGVKVIVDGPDPNDETDDLMRAAEELGIDLSEVRA